MFPSRLFPHRRVAALVAIALAVTAIAVAPRLTHAAGPNLLKPTRTSRVG
jgi:hypothetical protein